MSVLTPVITRDNINAVRYGILYKKSYDPFMATQGLAEQTMTDYDTFPYPRYFRGKPSSSEPVVAEREAGFRFRNDNCYKPNKCKDTEYKYPKHCFEAACSTVYPCFDRTSNLILKPGCVPFSP